MEWSIHILTGSLPVIIGIALGIFVFSRRKIEREYNAISAIPELNLKDTEVANDEIEKLVLRENIELRVLEEIAEIEEYPFFYLSPGKSKRERALEEIQDKLRDILRQSVEKDNFNELKTRILTLLDEIKESLLEIREKAPFDGLDDPERSLLIDLMEEIPDGKNIPRQKAQQLADIIKIKHQDIKKLQLQNAKSAAWTRWGTVGTISFGLLSLALSIYALAPHNVPSSSKAPMDIIKNQETTPHP